MPVMAEKAIMYLFTDRTVLVHGKPRGQAGLGHTADITGSSSRQSQAPGKPGRNGLLSSLLLPAKHTRESQKWERKEDLEENQPPPPPAPRKKKREQHGRGVA